MEHLPNRLLVKSQTDLTGTRGVPCGTLKNGDVLHAVRDIASSFRRCRGSQLDQRQCLTCQACTGYEEVSVFRSNIDKTRLPGLTLRLSSF